MRINFKKIIYPTLVGLPFLTAAQVNQTTGRDTSKPAENQAVQFIYYKVPERLNLASTDAVYNKDLMKSPVASFRNALTGRLAGLYTFQSSGLPGSDGASLTLRGQSPVIIIDGVLASLTTFDLEEIESVTVLKDALATSMLGSRGSHGAVLVTTRKGRNQKQQISFTAQTAIQKPISWPKTLDAYNYALLHNEALRNDGIDSAQSGLYYSQAALDAYKNGTDPIRYPNENYRDAITKKSSMFNRYTLSADGGGNFARYFISLEHINQSGFFRTVDSNTYNTNNNFKSYVIRSNVDVNITPKLTGGIYLLGRIMTANEPGVTTGTIISNLLNTPANAYPLLNPDNSFGGNLLYTNNLLAQTIGSGYRQRFFRDVLTNIYLQRTLNEITPGLWIKIKAAYNATLAEDIFRNKSFAVFQLNGANYIQFGTNGTQSNGNGIAYQARSDYEELSVGYDKTSNGNGFNLLWLLNRDNSFDANDPQALPYTISGTSLRAAYNYKGKYMIEGSFGANGSNRYPDEGDVKIGFFPAIGLGWNIEQEDFMRSQSFVSRLKLFGTYGKTGWDNPGYFIYYPRFFDGPTAYFGTGAGGVTTITEGTLPNRDITIEKANKLNIGLHGAFLDNKLGFTVEYFNDRYYDIMMQRGRNSSIIGNNPTYDVARWQAAADAALAVINSGYYSLNVNNSVPTNQGLGFYELFLKRVNSEYIFTVTRPNNKDFEFYYLPPSRSGANYSRPTQNLVDAFPMKNGKAIADPSSGYDPNNPYVNRDPRFRFSIIYNGGRYQANSNVQDFVWTFTGTGQTGDAFSTGGNTGYFGRKMTDSTITQNVGASVPRNWPLMRYAEILLNYAESINETGQTALAYPKLVELRARAGIDPGADNLYGMKAGMTKEEMRAFIQNERRIELAFEDHRWNDIRRWKIAMTLYNGGPTGFNKVMHPIRVGSGGSLSTGVGLTFTYQIENTIRQHTFRPEMYLLPIQDAEIRKMPAMIQNPGW